MGTLRSLQASSGFGAQLGVCMAALDDLRGGLVRGVEELSTETLARRAYAGANTIGTLLIHIAEAELFWVQEVIGGRTLTAEQRTEYRFDVFGRPGAPQVDPRDFGYFRRHLDEVRGITRETLRALPDDQIDARRSWQDARSGDKREFTVRWILHHVLEHEAHHRGQVFLLKRALGY